MIGRISLKSCSSNETIAPAPRNRPLEETAVNRTVAVLAVAAAVLWLCPGAAAQSPWTPLEDVRKQSLASDKPVFVLVISNGPQRQDAYLPFVRKHAESDTDATIFVKATVNLYEEYTPTPEEKARGHLNYRKNAELESIYGGVTDCAVIAPGGLRPLWKLKDGAKAGDMFKHARKAYEEWRKDVDALEKEARDDHVKRKDAAFTLKLAEAWAAGHASQQACRHFDQALKMLAAEDRAGKQGEDISLRAAKAALDGLDFADAQKRYRAFLVSYKSSTRKAEAQLGRAQALVGSGELDAAKKEIDAIAEDAPDDVRKLAAQVLADIERRQDSK